jgi:hypothetical protein
MPKALILKVANIAEQYFVPSHIARLSCAKLSSLLIEIQEKYYEFTRLISLDYTRVLSQENII